MGFDDHHGWHACLCSVAAEMQGSTMNNVVSQFTSSRVGN